VLFLLSSCVQVVLSEDPQSAGTGSQEPSVVESIDAGTDRSDQQEIEFSIAGGCLDSHDETGVYAIFEEFEDDCRLVVQVIPELPTRKAYLEYFDDGWKVESSAQTDSEGFAALEVDTVCEGGNWCEGIWEYRIRVEERDSLPEDISVTFELDFRPYSGRGA
jgi:hypothetical protein